MQAKSIDIPVVLGQELDQGEIDVLCLILKYRSMTVQNLWEFTAWSYTSLVRILKSLENKGFIRSEANTRWYPIGVVQ